MSKNQRKRKDPPPRSSEEERNQDPIIYGTVFDVSGELADKLIAPGDASMMQTAEATILGQFPQVGISAAMQAAANINVCAGAVGSTDVTKVAGHGITVTETDVPGKCIITESVVGQVVKQYVQAAPASQTTSMGFSGAGGSGFSGAGGSGFSGTGGYVIHGGGYAPSALLTIEEGLEDVIHGGGYAPSALLTIGEALEAVLQTCGDKPVDISDSAAIQSVEFLLTGLAEITPVGLTATAQSAAAYNSGIIGDEAKVKLRDILTGAAGKLPADRAVRKEDAETVAQAELQNSQNLEINPGGIAASMAAAAKLNEKEAQST